jgi:hypothetical protein
VHGLPLGSEGDVDDTHDEMIALEDPQMEQAKDLLLANATRRPGASGSDEDIHKVPYCPPSTTTSAKPAGDVVNSGSLIDRGANGGSAGANVEIV